MEVNQFSRFWLFFSHSTTATDNVLNVFYFLLFKAKEQSAKEQKSIQDSGSRGEGRSGAPGAQSWWDSLNIWTYRLIIWSYSSVFWRHSASFSSFCPASRMKPVPAPTSSALMHSDSDLDSDEGHVGVPWMEQERGQLLRPQNGSVRNGQGPVRSKKQREERL